MHDLSFSLTKDLVAALGEITGTEPTRAEPVVVLAAYVDALAKEYGLSESLSLDVDAVERTEQRPPVMKIITHYFAADATELDADTVRARLYEVFVSLAADTQARKILNRNRPLTESKFLHLAQIYWNLEATSDRPKLPIRPGRGRDIPVPVMMKDFATMTWTARVNQKGEYKSSGQSFRTQGARLAVLVAQQITANSLPAPASPTGELDVRRTADPDEPVEITLKELVWRAWDKGEYEDAVELSRSYLSIMERRANNDPFALEPDLAGAYLLKGSASMLPTADWKRSRFEVGPDTTEDLEKAVTSLTTLSELDPDNDEHRSDLCDACLMLCVAYNASDRFDEAAQVAQRAVSIAGESAATQTAVPPPNAQKRLLFIHGALREAFSSAGKFEEAAAASERAISIAEQLVETQPSEPMHEKLLLAFHWGLSQDLGAAGRMGDSVRAATRAVKLAEKSTAPPPENRKALASSFVGLSSSLSAAGRLDEAINAAERAVTITEHLATTQPADADHQLLLVAALTGLAEILEVADRFGEAVSALTRAVTILESLAGDQPTAGDYQERLGVWTIGLGRLHRHAGRFEEAAVAADRAVQIFVRLVASEHENVEYQSGLCASLVGLRKAYRALGRFEDSETVDDLLRDLGFD